MAAKASKNVATTTLWAIRSFMNAFTGLVVSRLASEGGLDAAQTKGLRNFVREACRNGGRQHRGYYALLPNAKSKDDGGAKATMVEDSIVSSARDTCTDTLTALISLMAKAGKVQMDYTQTDKATGNPVKHTVTVDCSKFKAPSKADLDALMEQAFSGGGNVVLEGF